MIRTCSRKVLYNFELLIPPPCPSSLPSSSMNFIIHDFIVPAFVIIVLIVVVFARQGFRIARTNVVFLSLGKGSRFRRPNCLLRCAAATSSILSCARDSRGILEIDPFVLAETRLHHLTLGRNWYLSRVFIGSCKTTGCTWVLRHLSKITTNFVFVDTSL